MTASLVSPTITPISPLSPVTSSFDIRESFSRYFVVEDFVNLDTGVQVIIDVDRLNAANDVEICVSPGSFGVQGRFRPFLDGLIVHCPTFWF